MILQREKKNKTQWDNELCTKIGENALEYLPQNPSNITTFDEKSEYYDESSQFKRQNCNHIPRPIEPITTIERQSDPSNENKPFSSGTDIFRYTEWDKSDQDNKINPTFGTFAAGISGHTIEISLMTNLFMSFTPKSAKNPIQPDSTSVVAAGALIWMSQYYHHSLREILLATMIHANEYSRNRYMAPLMELFTKDFAANDKSYERFKLEKSGNFQIPKPYNDILKLLVEDLDRFFSQDLVKSKYDHLLLLRLLKNHNPGRGAITKMNRLFDNYTKFMNNVIINNEKIDFKFPEYDPRAIEDKERENYNYCYFNTANRPGNISPRNYLPPGKKYQADTYIGLQDDPRSSVRD